MKLSKKQLEACAYIFEKEHGTILDAYQNNVVASASLVDFDSSALETLIVNTLNESVYDMESRGSAYFALSKRFNHLLIPSFRKWLQDEIQQDNKEVIFQLMIALDNLEEPVFHPDRSGYASFELELNIRDAKTYLNSI